MIIDHGGQVIGRQTITFEDNLVAQLFVFNANLPADQIREDRDTLFRHGQTNDIGRAVGVVLSTFGGGEVAAVAIIARGLTSALLCFAHGLEPLRCTVATIGVPRLHQLMGVLLIDLAALRLNIGAIGATNVGAFVPI